MNTKQTHRVSFLIGVIFASAALASERTKTTEEWRQVTVQIQKALSERFHFHPAATPNNQIQIPSIDCDIQLFVGNDPKMGARMEVKRGQTLRSAGVYEGSSISFDHDSSGFTFSRYTEDCETQGCDGDWYAHETIWIGNKIMAITTVEPYSHKASTLNCIFM